MSEITSPSGGNTTFLTTAHGLPFTCSADDPGISQNIAKGNYEFQEVRLFLLFLRSGQIVVDAGANMGYFTVLFARIVGPSGKVYAFEPEPFNLSLLRTNIEGNGLTEAVRIFPMALGESEGETKLYLSPDCFGDHRTWMYGPDVPHQRKCVISERMVKVTSLDTVLSEVSRIDILKIDVQGDEIKVLKGAKSIISRSPGMHMLIEYWPYGLSHAGGSPEEFFDILYEMGFNVCVIQKIENEVSVLVPSFKREMMELRDYYDNHLFREGKAGLNLWCVKIP